MNRSNITAITPNGTWRDMYKFEVTLADGAQGNAFSKSQQFRFSIGEEVEYMLNDKGSLRLNKQAHFGKDLSVPAALQNDVQVPQSTGKSFTKDELIIRQVSLKAAVDYGKDAGAEIKHILKVADDFYAWVLGHNSAPAPVQNHFDDDPF
jgi:hypothetical protein